MLGLCVVECVDWYFYFVYGVVFDLEFLWGVVYVDVFFSGEWRVSGVMVD